MLPQDKPPSRLDHLNDSTCPHVVLSAESEESLRTIEPFVRQHVPGVTKVQILESAGNSGILAHNQHRCLVCFQDMAHRNNFVRNKPVELCNVEVKAPPRPLTAPRSNSLPFSLPRDDISTVVSAPASTSTSQLERSSKRRGNLQRNSAQRNLQSEPIELLGLIIRYILHIADSNAGKQALEGQPELEKELQKVKDLHRSLSRPSSSKSQPMITSNATDIMVTFSDTLRNVAATLTLRGAEYFEAFANASLRSNFGYDHSAKTTESRLRRHEASSDAATSKRSNLAPNPVSRARSRSGENVRSDIISPPPEGRKRSPLSPRKSSVARTPVQEIWKPSPIAASAPDPVTHLHSDTLDDAPSEEILGDELLAQEIRGPAPSRSTPLISPRGPPPTESRANHSAIVEPDSDPQLRVETDNITDPKFGTPSSPTRLRLGHTRTPAFIPSLKINSPMRSESDPTALATSPRRKTQLSPGAVQLSSSPPQPSIIVHPTYVMTPDEHASHFATLPRESRDEAPRPHVNHVFGDIYLFNPDQLYDNDDDSSSSDEFSDTYDAGSGFSDSPPLIQPIQGRITPNTRPLHDDICNIGFTASPRQVSDIDASDHDSMDSTPTPPLSPSSGLSASEKQELDLMIDSLQGASDFCRYVFAATRRDFPRAFPSSSSWRDLVCPQFMSMDLTMKSNFGASQRLEHVDTSGTVKQFLLEKWSWSVVWVLISRYFRILVLDNERDSLDDKDAVWRAKQLPLLCQLASLNTQMHQKCAELSKIKHESEYQRDIILLLPLNLQETEAKSTIDRHFTSTLALAQHSTQIEEYLRIGAVAQQAITLNVAIHKLRREIASVSAQLHAGLAGEVSYKMALNGATIVLGKNHLSNSCTIV